MKTMHTITAANNTTLTITPTPLTLNKGNILANTINGINQWINNPNVSVIGNVNPLMSATVLPFKKYEINESIEDLLVLSCVAYRLRKSAPLPYGLLSNQLIDNVGSDDMLLANEIRDFYQQKFLVWKLKDKLFTQYRKDLNEFIHTDGKKFIDKMVPLVYRLPEMYDYDKQFDEVRSEFANIGSAIRVVDTTSNKFTAVICLERTTKGEKRIDYWLKDLKDHPYKFTLSAKNPILSLWEKEFNKNHIEMRVKTKLNHIDDLAFYSIQQIIDTV